MKSNGLTCDLHFVRPDMVRVRFRMNGVFRAEEKEMVAVAPLPRLAVPWKRQSGRTGWTSTVCRVLLRRNGLLTLSDDHQRLLLRFLRPPEWLPFVRKANPETRSHMGDGTRWIGADITNRPDTETGLRTRLVLALRPGDRIYGFGMSAQPVNAVGRSIDTWIDHFGADDYRTPWYWCSSGYGLFVRTTRRCEFDVGRQNPRELVIDVENEDEVELILCVGDQRQCLKSYTWLTGRQPEMPEWVFGNWMGGYWKTSRNLLLVASEFRRRKIPLDVMRLDSIWQRGHECDFQWDRNFSQASVMIRQLAAMNLKLHLWCAHVVNWNCKNLADGLKKEVFVKNRDGSIPLIRWWKNDRGAILDFTRAEASQWWQEQMRPILESGVVGFKTDGANEPYFVTPGRLFADGRTGSEAHNIYPLLYARCVAELQRAVYGRPLPIWIRSGYAGIQRYPVMWAGDQGSQWPSILMQIRAGISAGFSGVSFWASDGGGFSGEPEEELYIRGIQFAFWNPVCQPFGKDREPWLISKRAVSIFKYYAQLRNRLNPYLAALAAETVRSGLPMMRGMFLEFPDDPQCARIDDQYMLGSAFLVAPLYQPGGRRRIYLPAGDWADIHTGRILAGRQTMTITAELERITVFARCGTLVPMKPLSDFIEEYPKGPLSLFRWGTAVEYYRDSVTGAPLKTLPVRATDREIQAVFEQRLKQRVVVMSPGAVPGS
ncbi:MAG: hypothetical protein KKE37_11970 [Verrucomicrobia bacterium]|nr:hypothetical protein [Verrucomicrobiota bacterium]MBU4290464.1 hypothetical protein [Verrucomicrobiota bacterium]MBU4430052.1 hypothetical protein [Verrucomicrobiota bacterium]MCG2681121.1 hypothetical protein [Kiritimatiellia bacterium]